MTDAAAPSARALAIGERHLAMLAELGEIAMAVSRVYATSAMASAKTAEMIVGEEWFVPEVGRARACGAKDAAESFQKVSRAVRLTLMMEKATLEWMEGRRSEAPRAVAAGAASVPSPASGPRPCAGPSDRDWATDANAARREMERDRADDLDPPDALFHTAFRETVNTVCADVGAKPDWPRWTITPPDLDRRPGPAGRTDLQDASDRAVHRPP